MNHSTNVGSASSDNAQNAGSANQRTIRCSFCGNWIAESQMNFRPFCSRRCQQGDLANWLDEKYGLPWEGDDEIADE